MVTLSNNFLTEYPGQWGFYVTNPLGCRIVAYSDSEGEDEPFRLTRRHTKKKEREIGSDNAGQGRQNPIPARSKGGR